MRKDTHTELIVGKNFIAFISGMPDKCQHDDLGATVYETASGKIITWNMTPNYINIKTGQIAEYDSLTPYYESELLNSEDWEVII